MLNKVTLIGNLCRDPEIRSTQQGKKVANFTVATSEKWKDQSGEQKERTEFHNVMVFNEIIAKTAESYLSKGSKVYIEGAMHTRKWLDKQGQDRYSTEVVLQGFSCRLIMLSKAERSDHVDEPRETKQSTPASTLLEDEIPF